MVGQKTLFPLCETGLSTRIFTSTDFRAYHDQLQGAMYCGALSIEPLFRPRHFSTTTYCFQHNDCFTVRLQDYDTPVDHQSICATRETGFHDQRSNACFSADAQFTILAKLDEVMASRLVMESRVSPNQSRAILRSRASFTDSLIRLMPSFRFQTPRDKGTVPLSSLGQRANADRAATNINSIVEI